MASLFELVCQSVSLFVPRQYSAPAINRVWGSLDTNFKVRARVQYEAAV